MGHLRDLPKSQFGIDTEHDFAPKYINIRGKGDLIKALKKDAKNAAKIYLASDPDREGEAIAWHLAYILGLNPADDCRIVFNEITKTAIKEAITQPQPINMARVDAQQARRILDRIVGYKLSPLLWRKVKKGLSAGRVQSVAVKMLCDREKEIENFKPKEYWTIDVKLKKNQTALPTAGITRMGENKVVRNADDLDNNNFVTLASETQTKKIAATVKKQNFTVTAVKNGQRKKSPAPPFTTSSLQQDASHKLNFTSKRTMMFAQQLYEGVALGAKGFVGLITYMRTDSVRIAETAQNAARAFIGETFGEKYLPAKAPVYQAKKKAQDAHEAIRPTDINLTPESIEQYLTKEQFKLYRLIWQRYAASQMTAALYDTLTVDVAGNDEYFCALKGSRRVFDGFLHVYAENNDDKQEKDVELPPLSVGDKLTLTDVLTEQHFTQPPPRYNDASIVKALEEKEIGRPSTYAPIIDTILVRGYVRRVEKTFRPTEIGRLVIAMLEEYFGDIVDVKFTAKMENELDKIADGQMDKNALLNEFYPPFEQELTKADEAIGQVELPVEYTGEMCEKCGRPMVVKLGRYGKFQACSGFPECRNAKPILKDTGAKCPKCGGAVIERRSKRGRTFYGCANYPECDFMSWDAPTGEICKICGAATFAHNVKNNEPLVYCIRDDCESRIDHPINKILAHGKKTTDTSAAKKTTATDDNKPMATEKAAATKTTRAAAKTATKAVPKKVAAKTKKTKTTAKKASSK